MVNLLRRRATVLVVLHTVVELRETCAMYNTTKKLPDQAADRATLNPSGGSGCVMPLEVVGAEIAIGHVVSKHEVHAVRSVAATATMAFLGPRFAFNR